MFLTKNFYELVLLILLICTKLSPVYYMLYTQCSHYVYDLSDKKTLIYSL